MYLYTFIDSSNFHVDTLVMYVLMCDMDLKWGRREVLGEDFSILFSILIPTRIDPLMRIHS